MEGTYRLRKGWRISMYILCPILALAFFAFFIFSLIEGEIGMIIFSGVFGLPLAIFFTMALIDIGKGKFVIEENKLTVISLFFGTRSCTFEEVKGFRFNPNYIFIEPKGNKKILKISTYYESKFEIINWLTHHFPNLDQVEHDQGVEELLTNKNIGNTEGEVIEKFQKAKKVTDVFNVITIIAVVWVFVYPKPYDFVMGLNVILPIIGIALIYFFKGLIVFDGDVKLPHPNISIALVAPGLGLAYQGLTNVVNVYFSDLVLPTSIFFLMIVGFLLFRKRKIRSKKEKLNLGLVFLFLILYSGATVYYLNWRFDDSNPTIFTTTVVEKEYDDEDDEYFLRIAPWKIEKDTTKVAVFPEVFEKTVPQGNVRILRRKGRLGIPWFLVLNE